MDYGDVCINYDKAYFTAKNLPVPQSLEELLKPEYKGLLVVENPATSSPGLAFLLATIAHFGPSEYLDYWKALRQNGVVVVNGWETAYYTNFSASSGQGAQPMVVSYASSPAAEVVFASEPLDEAPTASILGQQTCFRQMEFVGILEGTRQRALAEKFIDFMLSVPFQEDMPLQMFVFPVNTQAELPDVFKKYAAIPQAPAVIPPEEITSNREEWIRQWTGAVLEVNLRQDSAVFSHQRWAGWLLWFLPLVFLGGFFFYPLFAILRQALLPGVQLDWAALWSPLRFTVVQAALSTLLTLLVGLPAAFLFARFRFWGKSTLQTLTTLPFILPTVVVAAGFNALLGPRGWINLGLMGLFQLEIPPMQLLNTLGAILLAHVFYNTTVVIRLVGSAWANLDTRLEQAGRVLGATPWQAFGQSPCRCCARRSFRQCCWSSCLTLPALGWFCCWAVRVSPPWRWKSTPRRCRCSTCRRPGCSRRCSWSARCC